MTRVCSSGWSSTRHATRSRRPITPLTARSSRPIAVLALDAATAAAHPDWVRMTGRSGGSPLGIDGAFAADFGNPAYRAWWIGEVATAVVMGAPALVKEGLSWREVRLRALHTAPVSLGPVSREAEA